MGGSFGEELFDGTLVVNGHTFPIPSFEADIALFVDAPGDVTAPPIRAEAVLSAPFRLRGSVEIFDFENVPTTTIAITGRGRITTHFVGLPQGAPSFWAYDRSHVEFESPTPEPATTLLVGHGTGGIAAATWQPSLSTAAGGWILACLKDIACTPSLSLRETIVKAPPDAADARDVDCRLLNDDTQQ